MAENPLAASLSNLGGTFRGLLQMEAQRRNQELQMQMQLGEERRALAGMQMQSELSNAQLGLQAAQEQADQRQAEQRFGLEQRRVDLAETTAASEQGYRQERLGLEREQLSQSGKYQESQIDLRNRELDTTIRQHAATMAQNERHVKAMQPLREAEARLMSTKADDMEAQSRIQREIRGTKLPIDTIEVILAGSNADVGTKKDIMTLKSALESSGMVDETDTMPLGTAMDLAQYMGEARKAFQAGRNDLAERAARNATNIVAQLGDPTPETYAQVYGTILETMQNPNFAHQLQLQNEFADRFLQEQIQAGKLSVKDITPQLVSRVKRMAMERIKRGETLGPPAPPAGPPQPVAPGPVSGAPATQPGVLMGAPPASATVPGRPYSPYPDQPRPLP